MKKFVTNLQTCGKVRSVKMYCGMKTMLYKLGTPMTWPGIEIRTVAAVMVLTYQH